MTPRERRLKRKKAQAAGRKTLTDRASSFVRSTNKKIANIFKSKPTKGRAVRGKTKRTAPKAPTLPKSQAMLTAEKRAAALKKKAAAESAASKKRLAAIRAGKNPKFPMTAAKPTAAKKTPTKKAPAAPSLKKFNAGKATTPERGRTFSEPPKTKAKPPAAPKLPPSPRVTAKPATKAKAAPKAKAKPAAKPQAKPSTPKKTASTYKEHGSKLHVGRYKTLAEHRAAVAARKKKQQSG